ncbi:MAG: metal ABC transporter ATP-binding protein [Eubacteriales bacterium]
MAQLMCKEVTLGYEQNVIVNNLSFSINKGDYFCIIGENGTGKTTLMKGILGLIKPMSGEIIWGDGLATNEIGYLTQQSEIQREFPASVQEVVLSGFQNRSSRKFFYTTEEKKEAHRIMKQLGIDSYKKKCYRELSGGQQQRVLLSRALCATRKMLFLDEPVAGLDPKISEEMYEVVRELNTIHEVTIIMISHDLEATMKYATHILKIGEESFFGTVEEYHKVDSPNLLRNTKEEEDYGSNH